MNVSWHHGLFLIGHISCNLRKVPASGLLLRREDPEHGLYCLFLSHSALKTADLETTRFHFGIPKQGYSRLQSINTRFGGQQVPKQQTPSLWPSLCVCVCVGVTMVPENFIQTVSWLHQRPLGRQAPPCCKDVYENSGDQSEVSWRMSKSRIGSFVCCCWICVFQRESLN